MKAVWFRGNPRLWYRDDLVNHPELIPLEGQNVKLPPRCTLHRVYPGVKLLTDKIKKLGAKGFENDDVILTASSAIALYPVSALFNEELTVENCFHITDQWLSSSSKLDSEQTIDMEFTNTDYVPTEYWIIPAAGVSEAPLRRRATPNTWELLGSNDKIEWTSVHKVENYNEWEPCKIQTFKRKRVINKSFKYLRFVIKKWNPGDDPNLPVGMRRLWIFGRETSTWTAPNIPSPDAAFVWVVPIKDIVMEKTTSKAILDQMTDIKEAQYKLLDTIKTTQSELLWAVDKQMSTIRRKNLAEEADASVKEALRNRLNNIFNTEN